VDADPATVLRAGLLAGEVVLGAVAAAPGRAALDECAALEARVLTWPQGSRDEEGAQAAVADALREAGKVGTLVVEPRLEGADRDLALVTALDETWNVVRATANAALIPGGGGKIVLIGPRADQAPHTEALRHGLENMARTLSIEWARHQVRPTMIAPGAATGDAEVATLVAFLASPAGDYYSGCRFELGSA
jgi:NAD(P)-dependent dehydrogenase (short-subunit alcohol dehydrogenase family)